MRFAVAPKDLDTRKVPWDGTALWGEDGQGAIDHTRRARWEDVRWDKLPSWSPSVKAWSTNVSRALGEWLIGDAHYVHKDEHLANIRRRGGLELYSSTDIFFGEVCLLSEVCRNSDKLFQIEAGEEFECDAEPSALLGGFLDAARRLGTAARKKRKS